jgi:hypothetical protein
MLRYMSMRLMTAAFSILKPLDKLMAQDNAHRDQACKKNWRKLDHGMLMEKSMFHFCSVRRLGNTNNGSNENAAPIRRLRFPPPLLKNILLIASETIRIASNPSNNRATIISGERDVLKSKKKRTGSSFASFVIQLPNAIIKMTSARCRLGD